MTVAAQVHENFKLFTGKPDSSGNIGGLADSVAAWVAAERVAPKSIGIEFLERSKTLLLSVGYRRGDEEAYTIKLSSTNISRVGDIGPGDLERIENGMAAAAAAETNVICHELYVTDGDELFMVTMART
ncbi:MAG: hypothetical protein ABJE66_24380 [Deltaproteobacteria bacterium]